jgi:2-dehydropantoate 2-reductase
VLSRPDEVAGAWDQLWLCISSPALRGDWLAPLVAAMGSGVVVSLLPGMRDREALLAVVPAERLVIGLIAFSSWHAPLGLEPLPEPGMAWWHPPLSPNLFEGPEPAISTIVASLRAGGCPAAKGGATAMAARGSSLLVCLVAAMECGGWTFEGLRQARWLELGAGAAREALTISTRFLGIGAGPMALLARPLGIRLISRLAPLVAPMDFEAFLRVHFSKVGDQTAMALETWVAEGQARGLPVSALQALSAALQAQRAGGSPEEAKRR